MRKAITQRRTNCRARCFRETGLRNDLNSGSASCMISTGGSFFSGWRMVRFLTTILPKSAERRKPPFEPTHVEKAQLQNEEVGVILVLDVVDRVGDREAEILVLDVAQNLAHVFQVVGQLELPSAIPSDMGDMAFVGPGLVGFPDRVEVHVTGRAYRVIGPEYRLEGWRSLD